MMYGIVRWALTHALSQPHDLALERVNAIADASVAQRSIRYETTVWTTHSGYRCIRLHGALAEKENADGRRFQGNYLSKITPSSWGEMYRLAHPSRQLARRLQAGDVLSRCNQNFRDCRLQQYRREQRPGSVA